MQDMITTDDNFIIDLNKKIFQYVENGILKSIPVDNIISCEIFADMSFLESEKINTYIETSYGLIPYFEDAKDLNDRISSSGDILVITFKDKKGKLKSCRKKYGNNDKEAYEIRTLINGFAED